jgi:hypothetical protein
MPRTQGLLVHHDDASQGPVLGWRRRRSGINRRRRLRPAFHPFGRLRHTDGEWLQANDRIAEALLTFSNECIARTHERADQNQRCYGYDRNME